MLIISISLFLIARWIVCFFVVQRMIDFYYDHPSGWDKHQQSIFMTYPDTHPFKMIFKFWVWPISKVYPEYHRYKKGN